MCENLKQKHKIKRDEGHQTTNDSDRARIVAWPAGSSPSTPLPLSAPETPSSTEKLRLPQEPTTAQAPAQGADARTGISTPLEDMSIGNLQHQATELINRMTGNLVMTGFSEQLKQHLIGVNSVSGVLKKNCRCVRLLQSTVTLTTRVMNAMDEDDSAA